jgi:hypothetical protein
LDIPTYSTSKKCFVTKSLLWKGRRRYFSLSSSGSKLVNSFHPQSSSHLTVFVLVFLDYIFLSVDNTSIRDAWKLFVMAHSADNPGAKKEFPLANYLWLI